MKYMDDIVKKHINRQIKQDNVDKVDFWIKTLGFYPENKFTPKLAVVKCYNCDSTNIKQIDSSAWTSKIYCKKCGYFTYILHADFIGGALSESVSIDKRDCIDF